MLNLENIPHTPEFEEVVLLDSDGQAIGRADKQRIHTRDTPLHSAFSIFLFDDEGQMLIQQRAWSKKTWPGIWSNACCGHPLPGESLESAAHRRLADELSLRGLALHLALPHFRYRAEHLGVVENEICPVFIGRCTERPVPNPSEVAAVDWVSWERFAANDASYAGFSPWSRWEAEQLHQSGLVDQLLNDCPVQPPHSAGAIDRPTPPKNFEQSTLGASSTATDPAAAIRNVKL